VIDDDGKLDSDDEQQQQQLDGDGEDDDGSGCWQNDGDLRRPIRSSQSLMKMLDFLLHPRERFQYLATSVGIIKTVAQPYYLFFSF